MIEQTPLVHSPNVSGDRAVNLEDLILVYMKGGEMVIGQK
jgi:hypothetical protein